MEMHNIPSEFPKTIVLYLKAEVTARNAVTAPEPCMYFPQRVSDELSSTSWFTRGAISSVNVFLWLENHLDLMISLFLALHHTSLEFLAFLQIKRWKIAEKVQMQQKNIGLIISHRTKRSHKPILPWIPLLHTDRIYFWSYRQINERRRRTLPATILTCNYSPSKYFQPKFPHKSPQIARHQNVVLV